jgi:hypothetical protein
VQVGASQVEGVLGLKVLLVVVILRVVTGMCPDLSFTLLLTLILLCSLCGCLVVLVQAPLQM